MTAKEPLAAEDPRPGSGLPPRRRGFWARIADLAHHLAGEVPATPEPVPAQPPQVVLELLRSLGVALTRAGEPADRVTQILDQVARMYGATGVTFFIVPTGLFVRIDLGSSSQLDFKTGGSTPIRLDQVDALYRLLDDIRHSTVDVDTARRRLDELLTVPPRFGPVVAILGSGILTLGLGLMLNPTVAAMPAFVLLGFLTGSMRWWADKDPMLSLMLPVATAFVVTWVVFGWAAPLLDSPPLEIVIPALVTFLPGAALTMGTVELSSGDMLAGSARLVYGLARLLLLSFGIAMGAQLAGIPTLSGEPARALGAWAPWVGVLVFGLGQYIASSAPRRTFGWLLVVLYVGYAAQFLAGRTLGSLGASFVAAAVVLPVCYAVQSRRSGPPVPVTFLPTFWLLVPGALGLQGVAQIIGADQAAGLGDFLNALMSVVAIAVGVLVGSGISERLGRATSTWRGI
ncbi:MAG TPA: threonine/serine exporter family protein [Intrasporangium sp.]|uniref:threonine/serine ThrE exporter family protein n=1 Tax=Intrasporangium sp. TaxID=1925024 RepID=UPI002F924FB8